MTAVRFTFEWYAALLQRLQSEGHTFRDFRGTVPEGTVLLRHDVDFSPRKALKMAELESDAGVSSTYFFLLSSPLYNLFSGESRDVVERIETLGHEIGLHFDVHQYWESEPGHSRLADRIGSEVRALSEVAADPTDVIAFHNPPDWTLGRKFSGFTHTYEERYFEEIPYVADSNQRWRIQPPFPDGIPTSVQLLTHPVLWGSEDVSKNEHLRGEEAYFRDRIRQRIESGFTDRQRG